MKANKTGKRIPIADAKRIGETHGYSQVIIIAWDRETGVESVCTWGKSITDCEQAANGGNWVKKAMGLADDYCHDKPARIKRKEKLKIQIDKN